VGSEYPEAKRNGEWELTKYQHSARQDGHATPIWTAVSIATSAGQQRFRYSYDKMKVAAR